MNAGTAGNAARWDGPRVVVGMATIRRRPLALSRGLIPRKTAMMYRPPAPSALLTVIEASTAVTVKEDLCEVVVGAATLKFTSAAVTIKIGGVNVEVSAAGVNTLGMSANRKLHDPVWRENKDGTSLTLIRMAIQAKLALNVPD